jgi:hypothetical protein
MSPWQTAINTLFYLPASSTSSAFSYRYLASSLQTPGNSTTHITPLGAPVSPRHDVSLRVNFDPPINCYKNPHRRAFCFSSGSSSSQLRVFNLYPQYLPCTTHQAKLTTRNAVNALKTSHQLKAINRPRTPEARLNHYQGTFTIYVSYKHHTIIHHPLLINHRLSSKLSPAENMRLKSNLQHYASTQTNHPTTLFCGRGLFGFC